MNIGDKLTWAYRSLFILMLVWLRFVEPFFPFWGVWIVWAALVYLIFAQPFKKKPVDDEADASPAAAGGMGAGQ